MFDTIVNPSSGVPRQRWTTTALSAVGHAAAIIVLVLSTLYATDVLPEPRETMAFFVAAPVPPPPPPAPPVAEPEPQRVKPVVTKASPTRSAPVSAKAPVAAPIEAPSSITAETGLEGGEFTPSGIEPGFENGVPGGVAGGIVGGVITAAPPPPPARVAPVRVGGEISAPRLIRRVDPEYPVLAVNAQIEGMVILEATVDASGAVRETRVLRSHSVLDQAATDAVRQWRYEPLLLNGKPTPFVLTVTVSFSLATR
ncbi:MAG TPA: energy transducer TonB [Vicinamibacterales bacterium]|jgi:protein TonB